MGEGRFELGQKLYFSFPRYIPLPQIPLFGIWGFFAPAFSGGGWEGGHYNSPFNALSKTDGINADNSSSLVDCIFPNTLTFAEILLAGLLL